MGSAMKKSSFFAVRIQEYKAMSGREKRKFWTNFFLNNSLYFMMIILVVYVTSQHRNFISAPSIVDLVRRSSSSLFMALGLGGIIVLTGTDLSAGRALGLTAVISASLLQRADFAERMWPTMGVWPIWAVALLVVFIGMIIGFVNGFFVFKFSLHPFIVTLSTQLILFGIILMYVNAGANAGRPISGLDPAYQEFVRGSVVRIFGQAIPNYVWFALIATIVMWVVWNKTVLGKNMYAVGANPEAAKVSGVNVGLTIIAIFVIAGALNGFAGFVDAARIGSNTPNTGREFELDAIAACVIGGVSFTGGVGKISGILTGVFMLQVIQVALQWLSVSASLQYVITGMIILVAVSLDMQKYLTKK